MINVCYSVIDKQANFLLFCTNIEQEQIVTEHLILKIDFVNRTPRGLEDVSKYPELFAELLRSGKWNVLDLKKVAGLNLLRVLRQVGGTRSI